MADEGVKEYVDSIDNPRRAIRRSHMPPGILCTFTLVARPALSMDYEGAM